jgi:cell wall-associated NlpC family hydrolase
MRARPRRILLAMSVLMATLLQARPAFAFSDVPSTYWDYTAITYVATTNTWMQDYGSSVFKPTTLELRELYARSLVKMYAPNEKPDPKIVIKDLPSSDPFWPYANVAIKLKWMPLFTSGNWAPTKPVKEDAVDKAIVLAMGVFTDEIEGLAGIHADDGERYSVDAYFPYFQLAHWAGFHYNHGDESLDLNRGTEVKRDEIAYTLWKAATIASWEIDDAARFASISLSALDETKLTAKWKHDLTAYSLLQLGYPYIWAGEWNAKSPPGYCCGSQPQGGMDCSGFVWWVMKRNEGNYNAAQYHPAYPGWALADRSSSYMAKNTPAQIGFDQLRIGDLMFFATNGGGSWSDVDHVAIYLGNGWMSHSSGSGDGPSLEWVADGYYHDVFVYGRRLFGSVQPRAPYPGDATAGDGPHQGGEPGFPR